MVAVSLRELTVLKSAVGLQANDRDLHGRHCRSAVRRDGFAFGGKFRHGSLPVSSGNSDPALLLKSVGCPPDKCGTDDQLFLKALRGMALRIRHIVHRSSVHPAV